MTDNLDVKTFDLASVLAGRDYPEAEIPVYFNEKLSFAISVLRDGVSLAETAQEVEKAAELQAQLDELVAKVPEAKYTVVVRTIPEGTRMNILEKCLKEFPSKKDVFGREEPNLDLDRAYTRRLWAAMIVKIVDPEGSITLVDEKEVENLQNFAPATACVEINKGIDKLLEDARTGFEYAAKEIDFLSNASREG